MMEEPLGDAKILYALASMKMPYGKYKGYVLRFLPVAYLEWFSQKGFPKNTLGIYLQSLYEIKLNGLEYLLNKIKVT